MKKHILSFFIILQLLAFTSCESKTFSFDSIKNFIETKYQKELTKETNDFLGECYILSSNNTKINICEKKYSNRKTDCDDWYNSCQMEILYKELLKTGNFKYGFGNKTIVEQFSNCFFVNYSVLAMFDDYDVQFTRYCILFDSEKSIIVQIIYKDFNAIVNELIKYNYVKCYTNENSIFYYWDCNENKKNELLDNLDCNESKLTVLQKFYNETKDLFNLLKASFTPSSS